MKTGRYCGVVLAVLVGSTILVDPERLSRGLSQDSNSEEEAAKQAANRGLLHSRQGNYPKAIEAYN
jgi:hypothetical protein